MCNEILFPGGRCASLDITESDLIGSNRNSTVSTRGGQDGMATGGEAEHCFENCSFRIDDCSEGEVITLPLTERAGRWCEVDNHMLSWPASTSGEDSGQVQAVYSQVAKRIASQPHATQTQTSCAPCGKLS